MFLMITKKYEQKNMELYRVNEWHFYGRHRRGFNKDRRVSGT